MTLDVFPMDDLVAVARGAGAEILRFYGAPGTVHRKADRSPLTEADRAAHQLLTRELPRLLPGVPVLSEESEPEEVADRLHWKRFWLVDPLDGTKEFLKGTGDFTVNVALIEGRMPTLAVVYAPATGQCYRASRAVGAQVSEGEGAFRAITTRPFSVEAPTLVASRDHAGPGVRALARALGPNVQFTSMGSSLKFCLVAEGVADLYLRDRPTMEWDTAAAQCVLERAGGAVYGLPAESHSASGESSELSPLPYNKGSLENAPFLAVGDPTGAWREAWKERNREG